MYLTTNFSFWDFLKNILLPPKLSFRLVLRFLTLNSTDGDRTDGLQQLEKLQLNSYVRKGQKSLKCRFLPSFKNLKIWFTFENIKFFL